MKTTVEIHDLLLDEARRVAAREGTTVRNLIEEGLRRALAEGDRPGTFRLRRAAFAGDGRRPEDAGPAWERIRNAAYESRGA
jgi:Bacterial antitoxin of type II TA system, VapB